MDFLGRWSYYWQIMSLFLKKKTSFSIVNGFVCSFILSYVIGNISERVTIVYTSNLLYLTGDISNVMNDIYLGFLEYGIFLIWKDFLRVFFWWFLLTDSYFIPALLSCLLRFSSGLTYFLCCCSDLHGHCLCSCHFVLFPLTYQF